MGVHGLSRWVKSNKIILSTSTSFPNVEEVEPVALVIDALAFLYHTTAQKDSIRGGNYSEYKKTLGEYVAYWRAVGLEPHFVFDGTFGSSKLETVQSRTEQSIKSAIEYMRSNDSLRSTPSMIRKAFKLPPLILNACISTLRILEVEMYFAEEEADGPTVELAQRLNGFAVSNDSDYFIFNSTSRGYIPLESLTYGAANSSLSIALQTPDNSPSVSMTIYHPHLIAELLDFPPSFLPLFACLIGNDHVDYSAELSLAGKNPFTNGQFDKNEFSRITKGLSSFKDKKLITVEDSFDLTLNIVKVLLGARVPTSILPMVEQIHNSTLSYNLTQYDSPTPSFPLHSPLITTSSLSQIQCKRLYLKAFEQGKISRTLVQVAKSNFIAPPVLLELPDLASISVVLGRPIRLFIYSILDNTIGLGSQEEEGRKTVTECVRRQEGTILAQVEFPDLKDLLEELSCETIDIPVLLLPNIDRIAILLAFYHSIDLFPYFENPQLEYFIPLILSLRHIQSYSRIPWTSHQLLSAIAAAVLLQNVPPSSHPKMTTSINNQLPPIKSHIHKSSELVTCLVHFGLLIETLLIKDGFTKEGHELFEGALFHHLLGLEEGKLKSIIRGIGKGNEKLVVDILGFINVI